MDSQRIQGSHQQSSCWCWVASSPSYSTWCQRLEKHARHRVNQKNTVLRLPQAKKMHGCCPEVMSQFHWVLLPSALARGSESRHKVRMYMHIYAYMYIRMWWVTLRNVTRNVVTYYGYRPYVHHIIWYARLRCGWIQANSTQKKYDLFRFWWNLVSFLVLWRNHSTANFSFLSLMCLQLQVL